MSSPIAELVVSMPRQLPVEARDHLWAQIAAGLDLKLCIDSAGSDPQWQRVSCTAAMEQAPLFIRNDNTSIKAGSMPVHEVSHDGRVYRLPAACDHLTLRAEAGTWRLDGDVIAALGSLLSLREEYEEPRRDRFGLVEGSRSPRHQQGALSEPLLENLIELIRSLLGFSAAPLYPNGATWAVAVSSDVDVLTNDHMPAVLSFLGERGVDRPTFFICPPSKNERTVRDPEYDFADPSTRAILAPLRTASVEIGLHGSYLAHDRLDWLKSQKQRLEDWCEQPVVGHRAHFYRFAYPRSWAWQSRAGLSYDASLGYPDLPGLRSGCASPTLFKDPEHDRAAFAIFPTCVLDQHFFWPDPWDDDRFEKYAVALLDRARSLRAAINLDWHSYTHSPAWPGWWNRLSRILQLAREAGAYIAGVAAVLKPHWHRWHRLGMVTQTPTAASTVPVRDTGRGAYYEQPSLWGNPPDPYQVHVQADILDLLPDDVTSVLDVGCGDGFVTNALPDRLKVIGVDLSAEALRYVRRPGAVAVGQFLPFADGQFDLVMANDVIEHLDDATRATMLKEMQRVSRKYLLITVPHDEQLEANCARCADCETLYHVHWHQHAFRADEMVRLAEPGFRALEIRYSGDVTLAPADPFVPLSQECGIYRTWQEGVCPRCKSPRQVSLPDDSLTVRLIATQRCEHWFADHATLFRQSNRSEIMGLYAAVGAIAPIRHETKPRLREMDPLVVDFANPLQAVSGFVVGSMWSVYLMGPGSERVSNGIRPSDGGKCATFEVKLALTTQAGDKIIVEATGLNRGGSLTVSASDGMLIQQRVLISTSIGDGRQRVEVPVESKWWPDRFGSSLTLQVSGDVVLHCLTYQPRRPGSSSCTGLQLVAGHNVLRTTVDGIVVSWGFTAFAPGYVPMPELTTAPRIAPRSIQLGDASESSLNLIAKICGALPAELPTMAKMLESFELIHASEIRKMTERMAELERSRRLAEAAYVRAEQDYLVTARELQRRMGIKGGAKEIARGIRSKLIGSQWPVPQPEFPAEWKKLDSLLPASATGSLRVLVLSHMFPHPDQPASGPFVHEQVKALRENAGIDARVLVGRPFWMNSRRPLRLWRAEQCYRRFHDQCGWWDLAGVPVRYLPYRILPPWGLHGWLYTQAMMRGIDELFGAFPFDLIHAHTGYLDGSAGRAIARRFGRPMIVTEHTGPFAILMNDRLVRRSTLRSLDESRKVIAVSSAQGEAVRSRWPGGADGRLTVVPNMVDTKRFHPPNRWTPNPAAPRFLFVGYFVPIKGLPILLDAFKLVLDRLPEATLTLAGGGENADQEVELNREIANRSLDRRVRVLGHQPRDEIARLMREECDILVLSSHAETFGCVVIEALASGKPVVSTRCGGPEDILTDERLGRLCEPGRADALSEAMLDVARRIREFDSTYLRHSTETRFGQAAVALRIRDLYQSVLK